MPQQPPISNPVIGITLDERYHIDDTVAAGGMATVYLATDTRLQRTVAVKIMHAHLAEDAQFRNRFLREAVASAKLSHPNVVNVYDQGHDAGLWYLVMEYVPSITLRDLLRDRGSLSPYEALSILSPALAGLAAAHDAGILHRDLKPENILLADDGRVKLADFGLARAVSQHTSPSQSLVGSVAYMSPELIARGSADARSDIYALGIILYEMLVGSRPFGGTDAVQIAMQHTTETVPPPSENNPAIPFELDELVQWTTAKRPEDRPPNAQILREQTEDILATLSAHATPTPTLAFSDIQATVPIDGAPLLEDFPAENSTRVFPSPASDRTQRLPRAIPPVAPTSSTDIEALQRRSHLNGRRGAALFLIVLILAALVGGTGWYFGSGPGAMTAIPDVSAQTQADATAILTGLNFDVQSRSQNDLTVPAGNVIATEPAAQAQAYTGSTVTLIVSAGPANADVPQVVGSDVSVATTALQAQGFVVSATYNYQFSSATANSVLAVANGTANVTEGQSLLQGTTLTLTLSLGAIPNVVGESQSDATTALRNAGLDVAIASTQFSDTVASGLVISQSNEKKTMTKGDTVSLVVSKGQDLVAVPTGVVGKSVSTAVSTLEAAGFTVSINNNWLPDAVKSIATVSRIDPTEGTQVKRGSTVTIYWSYIG